MTTTAFDLTRPGRPAPARPHPLRHSAPAIRTLPASAGAAPPHAAAPRHWTRTGVGLERVTPRPDSTGTCEPCGHVVVWDEVAGWLHAGGTSQQISTSPSPLRRPDTSAGSSRTANVLGDGAGLVSDERAATEARAFIAVLGPPASGKSTVTAALAGRLTASVFRLREFAHDYGRRAPHLAGLLAPVDALGWLRDPGVAHLLHAAFMNGALSRATSVLLENLPGNRTQLEHIVALAAVTGASLGVVELTAPDDLLRSRASARRVCPRCEPDPRGDPHRPALGLPGDPLRCARCGGSLVARLSDAPHQFEAKLARYRSTIDDIRRSAQSWGLPYLMVDAAADRATLLSAAEAAARSLLATPRVKETV